MFLLLKNMISNLCTILSIPRNACFRLKKTHFYGQLSRSFDIPYIHFKRGTCLSFASFRKKVVYNTQLFVFTAMFFG